jgi:hypothetical protein
VTGERNVQSRRPDASGSGGSWSDVKRLGSMFRRWITSEIGSLSGGIREEI